jgi:hypothetical protein
METVTASTLEEHIGRSKRRFMEVRGGGSWRPEDYGYHVLYFGPRLKEW